jgi:hypothetical protein
LELSLGNFIPLRIEVDFKLMEATHSSRSSSDETEYDPKIELVENSTASDQNTSTSSPANGENSAHQANAVAKAEFAKYDRDDDVALVLRRKINVGDMRVPELQISGCSDGEDETESDDDLCSSSDDDDGESYDPFASGVVPPVLPDIQLRVPMEDANDVQRVKDALLIKGVLDVVCDEERQIVTVTGIVPPLRLLKKVRKVKSQARIISTSSPFACFVNPNTRPSTHFAVHEELQDSAAPIDIPSSRSGVPNFVVLQQRPRPTFQRFNFHNDPHSPYLRTFSPSDLSPVNSPMCSGDRSRCDSDTFFDDDMYQGNGFIFT